MQYSDRHIRVVPVLLFLLVLTTSEYAQAWVYPEHRAIMAKAIQGLDPQRQQSLHVLWKRARTGFETRLCDIPADTTWVAEPSCIDLAAWSAIGGDHSCSPRNLLDEVLYSDWIMRVATVTAELEYRLNHAQASGERINALRDSDLKLQRADPLYATRAGSNNVHFLLARDHVDQTPMEFAIASLRAGAPLNATGAYIIYHLDALRKAKNLATDMTLTPQQQDSLARAILADEMYAAHFLEDAFSSGHVAGTWGDASKRKGTHDYYCEHGIATSTWSGEQIVLSGDAYMREEDAGRAAVAVRSSLEAILDMASGVTSNVELHPENPIISTFDVCINNEMPTFRYDTSATEHITQIFRSLPVPGLASGIGELPRFQAELGPFIGLAPAMRSNSTTGFEVSQNTIGVIGGMEFAIRLGYGIEGVLNESGDGLVFLEGGFRTESSSTMTYADEPELTEFGTIFAVIPSRDAYTLRLRMPFWLIPGDLIFAAPLLLLAPSAYAQMAVGAGNGGLIPWQTGLQTVIGRFQFMLGREIGAALYGYGATDNRLLFPIDSTGDAMIAGVRTIRFDFPVLEYRPFRSFSSDQSSSLMLQVGATLEVPTVVRVVAPSDAAVPSLRSVWGFMARIVFDWRAYL